MWAVIRYSTGKRIAYFTSERDAQTYCEDQCRLDELIRLRTHMAVDPFMCAPDWGWLLVPTHHCRYFEDDKCVVCGNAQEKS